MHDFPIYFLALFYCLLQSLIPMFYQFLSAYNDFSMQISCFMIDQLINTACHQAMNAPNCQSDISLSLSASRELQFSGAKFDLSKEEDLCPLEFIQASTTLILVIYHCFKAGPENQIDGPTAHVIADSF